MDDEKVVMMVAAGKAIDYLNDKPEADSEEVIRYVMKEIRKSGREARIMGVAAANRTIQYKQTLKIGDKGIMQRIMNELPSIVQEASKEID